MQDLTGVMPDDEYQDASMAYWTDDARSWVFLHMYIGCVYQTAQSEEFKDRPLF